MSKKPINKETAQNEINKIVMNKKVIKAALSNYIKQLFTVEQKIGSKLLFEYDHLHFQVWKLTRELEQEKQALEFFKGKLNEINKSKGD